jgi:predicted RNA-binding Zn ribbon-like protein
VKRASTRPRPGGPLPIDLLNTRWLRDDDQEFDWLLEDAAVVSFNATYAVKIDAKNIAKTRVALISARDVVQRIVQNSSPNTQLIADVNAALKNATVSIRPSPKGARLHIVDSHPTRSIAVQAIINTIELACDHPNRIRTCDHPQCVLWFLDTSKSGQRRWCSMDTCGNRAKASRHYNRTH